jgi:hypothetical protein
MVGGYDYGPSAFISEKMLSPSPNFLVYFPFSMEYVPSWKTDGHSACQEIAHIL